MVRKEKKEKRHSTSDVGKNAKSGGLWRKPILLESFEEVDPLAGLYQGREVLAGKMDAGEEKTEQTFKKERAEGVIVKTRQQKSRNPVEKVENQIGDELVKTDKNAEKEGIVDQQIIENEKNTGRAPRISEEELKSLLKIKSDYYEFTDIREILRGKSFDIYTYLRFLAGKSGVCKIKHLDLTKKLNISRPTLFKQGDWLIRLSLIEKRSVPGDHLGTTYQVNLLEDVLPVSDKLVEQVEAQIESIGKNAV